MPTTVESYESEPHQTGLGLGLHHVQLALPPGGEEECRNFYVGVLGLAEVQKPPILAARGGLWVRADGLEIHLGVEEEFRPQKKAHPGILVRDIDALALRVESHGYEPDWDNNFPGMRRFYLWDNNGNRLEFLSPSTQTETAEALTRDHMKDLVRAKLQGTNLVDELLADRRRQAVAEDTR